MFKFRMIGKIIRQAKLGHITVAFAAIFVLCAAIIASFSPSVGGFGNAMWLCFQTATTIGFGDVSTHGLVVRIPLIVVSILSVFYLAVITGVVVAYCVEITKAQANDSLMALADDLEHLDEKTPEELREISERVRKRRMK